ncbi:hypothetical protein E2C01_014756 [Portunus trituberculatus]|uniref:Uncharacterized protein n=1 Tax=Portunus trituberculatus TaxID=210409 RepID=A0A5B7DJN0_PORTR|nr:hypothetical protein [Portunus trituberculatus]
MLISALTVKNGCLSYIRTHFSISTCCLGLTISISAVAHMNSTPDLVPKHTALLAEPPPSPLRSKLRPHKPIFGYDQDHNTHSTHREREATTPRVTSRTYLLLGFKGGHTTFFSNGFNFQFTVAEQWLSLGESSAKDSNSRRALCRRDGSTGKAW